MSDASDKSRLQIKSPYNRNPTGKGGFRKGKSGNPGGLTKEYAQELRRNAPTVSAELLRIALHGEKESDRVAACRAYLDRAWGVMQSSEYESRQTTITVEFARPDPKSLPPL